MRLRPSILLALLAAALLLTVAVSARRLAAARAELEAEQAALQRTAEDARRIVALRGREQRVAEQKRPEQDVIARVNAALSAAGISQRRFAGLRPQADSALPGGEGLYRRQSVNVRLRELAVPEIGAFLRTWAESQNIWTPTSIELTHVRRTDDPARYDLSLNLSATYVADR